MARFRHLALTLPLPCHAGWREFVTLTALFDCDAGFLVNDTVVFSADVLVLRESSEARSVCSPRAHHPCVTARQYSIHRLYAYS